MNPRWTRLLLVAPVFLVGVGVAAVAAAPWSAWMALGFVATALPLLALIRRDWLGYLFLPLAAALLAVLIEGATTGAVAAGPSGALLAGVLVASPLPFLVLVDLLGSQFGLAYLALGEGLAQTVALFAAAAMVAGAGGAAFAGAYGNALITQLNGVAQIVHGGGAPTLPLATAGGPVFYLLALVAFVGSLLGSLRPSGPEVLPEPPPAATMQPPRRRPDLELSLPPPVAAALRGRTPDVADLPTWRVVSGPVMIGAVVIGLFLGVAAGVPTSALAFLGFGAVVAMAAILILGRVPRPAPVQGGEPSGLYRL